MERAAWMTRRGVLRLGLCASALIIPAGAVAAQKDEKEKTPNEHFMMEHGALDRLLLIFKECAMRLEKQQVDAAKILRRAAEKVKLLAGEHHQKEEEEHVFPLFEKQGQLAGLVRTLHEQHDAGRKMTARIIELTGQDLKDDRRGEVVTLVQAFARMNMPHVAIEETVLFPAFQEKLGKDQYMKISEAMEKMEKQVLGSGGMDKHLQDIEAMEKELGINDLNAFTVKI